MLSNAEQVKRLLRALSEKMESHRCRPVGLVVCGGAAMNVAGLVERPTRDIDVLATAEDRLGGTELRPAELPDDLRECVRQVAQEFGLPAGWLNPGRRELFGKGLPEGISTRLQREDFGPRLRIYWTGREDLISLKLLAAADERADRTEVHMQDLAAMRPSFEELDKAVDWIRNHEAFEEMKPSLKRLLIHMGHEDLAYYV